MEITGESPNTNSNSEILPKKDLHAENGTTAAIDSQEVPIHPGAAAASIAHEENPQHTIAFDTR